MLNHRKARELALQILFLWDAHGGREDESAAQVVHDASAEAAVGRRAMELASGAWEQRQMIDERLERLAPQWPPRRQPGVDRSLLRLGVYELTAGATPPKVVLDEAIELAKTFSTEQSAAFINGVLDAVLREHRALTDPAGPAPAPLAIERPQ